MQLRCEIDFHPLQAHDRHSPEEQEVYESLPLASVVSFLPVFLDGAARVPAVSSSRHSQGKGAVCLGACPTVYHRRAVGPIASVGDPGQGTFLSGNSCKLPSTRTEPGPSLIV